MLPRLQTLLLLLTILAVPGFAQTDAEKKALQAPLDQLQKQVDQLDVRKRVDAEICAKAVEWILRHDEFFKKNYLQAAQKTLQLGEDRVAKIQSGKVDWATSPGVYPVAYRSRVDESVQPYQLTLPEGFEKKGAKRWPLYVVLHGRNQNLTEASFIAGALGKSVPKGQDWIQIDVFGRTNNAYRWAGETDVFEAIDDVSRRCRIDESRITLWGFSMGGAGAWHLGLHHPSRWASVGAGAGFVDFYKYQKQDQLLPEYQHRPLRIYDSVDYALNLNVVPFITYGGEVDPQLQASLLIQDAAKQHGIDLNLIIGPKMGHKFDDASKAKFMEFLNEKNQQGRQRIPGKRKFEFITYTLKYNQCEWLDIHEQAVPYEKTYVKSDLADDGVLELKTENVTALSILRNTADEVRIDGAGPFQLNQVADANLVEVYFLEDSNGWHALNYEESLDFEGNPNRNKRHNLQGPIDDAFMEPFVCVTGTGTPWSQPLQAYADWSLQRFEKEFDKWMRAKPVVVEDQAVDAKLIRDKNLILFGDPGSNSLISRVIEDLPLEWSKEKLTFQGQDYTTDRHAVVLIFPNPLNPRRYVVINSGMTTREKDFKASNSWLFPKLGDHAVIHFERGESGAFTEKTIKAGIFDSHWNR